MNLKKIKSISLTAFFLFILLSTSVALAADPKSRVNAGLDITAGQAGIIDTAAHQKPDLASALGTVINYIFIVVGLVFFTFILVGGYMWMRASGNEEGIKKAKTLILNAIFGLMVIFFAYTLVWLILNALRGATFPKPS